MGKSWKEIWNGKQADALVFSEDEFEMFCALKKLDGFDVAVQNEESYFKGFYLNWLRMHDRIKEMVSSYSSVYEVGCGGGVNLYMFKRRHPDLRVGGVDYSNNLLDCARQILPEGSFEYGEASRIREDDKYDIVISDSVFQYFPSEEYAGMVLRKMLSKASKLCFLGEVHDKDLEDQMLDNRRKTIKNYDELYEGLQKTFLTRGWIQNIASEYNRQVIFETKSNPEYWSSDYIFDVYIY